MYNKFGTITHNKKKIKYIYCDTYGLLTFLIKNINYKKSFIKILKSQRKNNNDIINLVIENYRHTDRSDNLKYLLIYDKNNIITTSKILYKKKALISFVHTNEKYRGLKFCQLNIKKIVQLTNREFNIKTFELDVAKTNTCAIHCYKKSNFKIINSLHNDYFIMKYLIK